MANWFGGERGHALRAALRKYVLRGAMVLAGLVLAGLLALGLLQTPAAKGMLARQLSSLLSEEGKREVRIGAVTGWIPAAMDIESVTVSDGEGVWLSLRNLRLRWPPLGLLAMNIDVEELTVETVEVARPPIAGEKSAGDESSTFSIPRIPENLPRIRVTRFGAERILLGREVLGREARYSLSGRVLLDPGAPAADVNLSLRPAGKSDSRANVLIGLGGDPLRLEVDVSVHDSKPGLFLWLAGLRDKGPMDLTIRGDGPLDGWKGRIEGSAEGLGRIDSDVAVERDEGYAVRMDGALMAAGAVLPAAHRSRLRQPLSFGIAADLPNARLIRLRRFEAEYLGGRMELGGAWRPAEDELNARLNAGWEDLSRLDFLLDGRMSGQLAAEVLASGSLLNPDITAGVRVSDARIADVSAALVETELSISELNWTGLGEPAVEAVLSGTAESLSSARLDLPAQTVIWSATLRSETWDDWSVSGARVRAAGARLDASGTGSLRSMRDFEATASLEIPDLKPLAAAAGQTLSGALVMDATAAGASATNALTLRWRGSARRLRTGRDRLDSVLGDETAFRGSAASRDFTEFELEAFQLRTAGARLDAAGFFNRENGAVQGEWSVDEPSLGAFSTLAGRELAGGLSARGSIRGTTANLEADSELDSDRIGINGLDFSNLQANLRAAGLPARPKGSFNLAASHRGGRLSAEVPFTWEAPVLRIRDFAVRGAGAEAAGSLVLDTETRMGEGSVEGGVGDLESIGRLLGTDLDGRLVFNASFQPAGNGQRIEWDAAAANIEADIGSLDEATIRGRVEGFGPDALFSAEANARGLSAGAFAADTVSLSAVGGLSHLDWRFGGEGKAFRDFVFDSEGTISQAPTSFEIGVRRLEGEYGGRPLGLKRPFSLSAGDGRYRLSDAVLALGNIEVSAGGEIDPDRVDAELRLIRLPLAELDSFGVTGLAGDASGAIAIGGDPSAPVLSHRFAADGIRYERETLFPPPGRAVLEGGYQGRRFETTLEIGGFTPEPVRGRLGMEAEWSLMPFRADLPGDARMEGGLEGRFDLSVLPSVLALRGHTAKGMLEADVEIAGRLRSPDVRGTLQLDGGEYEFLDRGVALRGIELDAELNGRRVVIKFLRAEDGEGGGADISGHADLTPELPVKAVVRLDRFHPLRMDEISTQLSGGLSFEGPARSGELGGSIQVLPTEIHIPRELPQEAGQIEVIETGRSRDEPAEGETAMGVNAPIRLNIGVEIPGRVFVRGRGLESEWRGNLTVKGTAAKPVIEGNLSIVRGHMNFFGNRFSINQGSISFGGSTPPNPFVNIQAETTKKGATFFVRIQGPAAKPMIMLDASPPMPRDEVFSRLLFGRRLTDITPFQALRLANAANALRGGGLGPVGGARDFLGLDQLEIRQGGDGGDGEGGGLREAAVGIGKYLTDDIYLDFQQGMTVDSGKLTIEVQLTPNLSLESEVGANAKTGLGVLWKYDY